MLPTRRLFILHRYSGLLTAPLILFFALSGMFQVFRKHEDSKKSGYKAPAFLKAAADFHKAEGLHDTGPGLAFKTTIAFAAWILTFAASLGIILGFRTTRPRWLAALLLSVGVALPLVLYMLALNAATG